jgi:hypothetical protein
MIHSSFGICFRGVRRVRARPWFHSHWIEYFDSQAQLQHEGRLAGEVNAWSLTAIKENRYQLLGRIAYKVAERLANAVVLI